MTRLVYRSPPMRGILFLLLFVAAPVALADTASEEEIGRRVSKLSDQLKSPFCPGKTLLTCTSGQAYDLRKEIRDMMARGMSEAEIKTELEGRYEDISNPPQPWYTFFVPFLPWVVGLVLVGWVLRRWLGKAKTEAPADVPAPSSPEDEERLARLRRQIAQED